MVIAQAGGPLVAGGVTDILLRWTATPGDSGGRPFHAASDLKAVTDPDCKTEGDWIVAVYTRAEAGEAIVIRPGEFPAAAARRHARASRSKPRRIRATYKRSHGAGT